MAEFTAQQGTHGHATFQSHGAGIDSNTLTNITNIAGAGVSLALIVGLGVWGYQLFMRDVSGIPVVHAAQGEMRVRPEDPGGQLARHQGLSVNEVAGTGAASGPAQELRLAPEPVALTEEDTPQPLATVASLPQAAPQTPIAEATAPDVATALQSGNINDLADQLTEGTQPLEPTPVAAVVPPVVDPNAPVPASLRPVPRPARLRTEDATAAAVAAAVARALPQEIAASDVAAGTRLVQLGSFPSEAVARQQWDRLQGEFSDFMRGKSLVVQQAQSGGRTFYRLRAAGFSDTADTRRFCSALIAADADCVPVIAK